MDDITNSSSPSDSKTDGVGSPSSLAEKSEEPEVTTTKKKHHSVGDIILYVIYGVIASALGIALIVYSKGDTTGILAGLALLAYGLWVFSGAFTGGWRPIFYIVG